ncbi:hypothetical protein CHCC20496_2533 [Bacillus licheniformis]|nr:hypothetical protein CHCC20496_2533 [Bacillus licheniformis]
MTTLFPLQLMQEATYFALIIEILKQAQLWFFGITKKHLRIQKQR